MARDIEDLTPKEELFVLAYTTPGTDTHNKKGASALAAGCPEVSASSRATELLNLPRIQAKIQEWKDRLAGKYYIKAEDVIKELAAVGFSNIKDYLTVDENGEVHIKDFEEIDEYKLRAIESVKITTTKNKDGSREYTTTQFKLHNKLIAIDQLNKYLGLYKEDNVQKGEEHQLSEKQAELAEELAPMLIAAQLKKQREEVEEHSI